MKIELKALKEQAWKARFQPVATLAKRAFSSVTLVEDREIGCLSVLKTYEVDSLRREERSSAENELSALLALKGSTQVTQLLDAFAVPGRVCLELEYLAGGTLREVLKSSLTSVQALSLSCQLCEAVQAVHSAGLVHLDIKPENLLLNTDHTVLKLADFGCTLPQGCFWSGQGTIVAPELLRRGLVTFKADVWAVGEVLALL